VLKGIDNRLNAEVLGPCGRWGTATAWSWSTPTSGGIGGARHRDRQASADGELDRRRSGERDPSVLPLDTFVEDFAGRMEVVGHPEEVPPVQVEVQAEVDRAEGRFRPRPASNASPSMTWQRLPSR
jgi:L-fucose mutarotase